MFDSLVLFCVAFSWMSKKLVSCRLVELAEYQGQNKQIRTSFIGLELHRVKELII